MASEGGLSSPESGVTSLLAASGRLQSSVHPEPVPVIRYKNRCYVSASAALDAYITDFHQASTGTLELPKPLPKPQPRNRDVLKSSLTDGELSFLNLPVRKRDVGRLSVTTDDLLALPNDGSLPVTRTSALLCRPFQTRLANRKFLPVESLLMGNIQAPPPPRASTANQTPGSSCFPRWMTNQKSEMDFSSLTSVHEPTYPLWLEQCEASSDGELEKSSRRTRPQATDKMGSRILRAEEPLKKLNTSGEMEDALEADRSWDNPPVTFKPPVPVGGADESRHPEDPQRSKSAASCSSGYSSRKHPGPVEALKHMLFRLQAVEHKISQSHARQEREPPELPPLEDTDLGSGESLQRALHHLDRLKTLVDDMNERKARAVDDGTVPK